MPLTGSLVNFGAILAGGALGLLFQKGLPKKYLNAVIAAVALVVFALGVSYAIQSKQVLVLIISVLLGTLVGTVLQLERGLVRFGEAMQKRLGGTQGRFAEGFVTCSLLYCVGAMAVTGAIQGGLNGDHTVLYVKAVMDGVTAVFFASTLGVGVLFSAVPVLIYQGAVALAASALSQVLDANMVTEMAAAGGVALMALSLTMLEVKRLEAANMLPAIFLPIGILPLVNWLLGLIN